MPLDLQSPPEAWSHSRHICDRSPFQAIWCLLGIKMGTPCIVSNLGSHLLGGRSVNVFISVHERFLHLCPYHTDCNRPSYSSSHARSAQLSLYASVSFRILVCSIWVRLDTAIKYAFQTLQYSSSSGHTCLDIWMLLALEFTKLVGSLFIHRQNKAAKFSWVSPYLVQCKIP